MKTSEEGTRGSSGDGAGRQRCEAGAGGGGEKRELTSLGSEWTEASTGAARVASVAIIRRRMFCAGRAMFGFSELESPKVLVLGVCVCGCV